MVTQTTTVAFETASGWESVGTTRALTDLGVKTFAVGDQIAVVYTNTSNSTVKVESAALTAADIAAGGRSAKIKVTMTNPKASTAVTYIYPAAMADANGSPKLTALDTQGGTLASLASVHGNPVQGRGPAHGGITCQPVGSLQVHHQEKRWCHRHHQRCHETHR